MTHTLFNIEKILINVSTISDVQKLVLYPRVVIIGSSDPVYTVPDEFGTGLKFVLFRLFTREFVLLGGLKFVRFRGSRVFTRPKRPNFSPVPNSSGTV